MAIIGLELEQRLLKVLALQGRRIEALPSSLYWHLLKYQLHRIYIISKIMK